ncbi:MAG TPA: fluoride efflux transporter CrcB [Candidatus Omnitrophica bacterium]|nr:fluoride efflux transporter CrcB [Candidatus Omnitrophota bacterium]
MPGFLHLAIGGAVGTVSRYLLGGLVYRVFGTNFPYGTLAVNLSGCFAIGFLASMAEKKFILGAEVRTLLMIGFCGAFTTFSTLIFETDALIRDGEILRASANIILSILFGFILFRTGAFIAEAL